MLKRLSVAGALAIFIAVSGMSIFLAEVTRRQIRDFDGFGEKGAVQSNEAIANSSGEDIDLGDIFILAHDGK